jgi:high-affinity iron transporter
MRGIWRVVVVLVVAVAALMPPLAAARGDQAAPWQIADQIRKRLLAAQSALLSDTPDRATAEVAAATALYEQQFRPLIAPPFEALTEHLDEVFVFLGDHTLPQYEIAIAVWRGRAWTGMLHVALAMATHEAELGNAAAASDWLLLREFRPSTIVARPSTDATTALTALANGQLAPAAAAHAVRKDLLDTYLAKLHAALKEIRATNGTMRHLKRGEQIGLAAGYFEMIKAIYGEQRGAADVLQLEATFATLVAIGEVGASDELLNTLRGINKGLAGFIPIPLTEGELSARAGQMMRYLTLVPLEYNAGVRAGEIINDVEYMEALTFTENALTAFKELKHALTMHAAADLVAVETQFAALDAAIRGREDERIVRETTFDLTLRVSKLLPSEWRSVNSAADVAAIRAVLGQVKAEVLAGQYDRALAACVHVYSIIEQSLQQKLLAFAPDVALRLDTLLWQGDATRPGLAAMLARHAPTADIQVALARLEAALDQAELALRLKHDPGAVVGNTAIIVFREGLEAILILIALLASLRTEATRRFRPPILIGALGAVVAAALTWVTMYGVLRAFVPPGVEMEAIISLVAIAVMVVVTNWFFHRVYWTERLAGFHARKADLIRVGQAAGLVGLGFISVYREGFETALFLQPLTVNASFDAVLFGVLLGAVGVAAVGVVTLALHRRLPYRQMLIFSGLLTGVVLLILVGNTVYVMQIAGWVPISPIGTLVLPHWVSQWLGVYNTWQGVGAQVATAVLVLGSYVVAEGIAGWRRSNRRPRTA